MDEEVQSMSVIYKLLSPLSRDARTRIIDYLISRLEYEDSEKARRAAEASLQPVQGK